MANSHKMPHSHSIWIVLLVLLHALCCFGNLVAQPLVKTLSSSHEQLTEQDIFCRARQHLSAATENDDDDAVESQRRRWRPFITLCFAQTLDGSMY